MIYINILQRNIAWQRSIIADWTALTF